jgi:hypothetical protein
MESPPLAVAYETLVEQLQRSQVLLLELQTMEQTLRVQTSVELLELARSRMFAALHSLP